MVEKLALHFKPERMVLFGSQARGEVKALSDVDSLVIANTDLPRPQRSAPMYSLLRDNPFSKDIIVLDPLTQIANSRKFYLLAEAELARAERNKSPVTLALVDIDNFTLRK